MGSLTRSDLTSAIDSNRIEQHIATLASDAFLGRKPGTMGEHKTLTYLSQRLQEYGIEPANGDSYFQEFTISEVVPVLPETLTIKKGDDTFDLEVKEDFVAKTSHYGRTISVKDAEIAFVGFGITAPEYGWDDYQNIDVEGKVVMTLFSDPGLYDTTLFNGLSGTVHASISDKQTKAKQQGAVGFLTIFQDTGPTGFNWPLVQAIATRSTYYLEGDEPNTSESIDFGGMVSIATAKKLLKLGGQPENYIEAALSKDFKPANLGVTASIQVSSELRKFKTNNVIGMVKGTTKPEETIVYTAHWDHDGIAENPVNGDSILNGAIDNASGTAMVLETARIFSQLKEKPERSVLFFLTAAEEMGLLGAKYYTEDPLFPLEKTVAVINTDAAHATQPMRIAVNVLMGHSDMDSVVLSTAKEIGREIIPDPTPQIGAFHRSDHYPFVQKGIPAVWAVGGADPMRGDSAKAMQIIYDYGPNKYHQVTDEYYEGFLMGNITLDATHNLLIGHQLATGNIWPNWVADSPYKPLRDSLLNLK
ncbi:MAG: M28 family metallopeptidase [Ekhidna sp.]